jgi:hypothetical protein
LVRYFAIVAYQTEVFLFRWEGFAIVLGGQGQPIRPVKGMDRVVDCQIFKGVRVCSLLVLGELVVFEEIVDVDEASRVGSNEVLRLESGLFDITCE